MKQTDLGRWIDDEPAFIDVDRLMETRALIQANSGGGKSWLLRKLLEVTAGKVQQFIMDPEGEFASLREKHDLIVAAANGGDALAHPKTAKLLAIRLLETQASAVLDLYELKAHERHQFVRLFLESMMNAPKTLWRPVLVALDESHLFCPEKGQGESEATESVIDLSTRGRKRGFALVAATQRIGKFHKSAAAELKNKLIGSTGLDVDVKRAAFDLGLQPREALEKLRALQAGHFFAFGPALNQVDPRELVVGKVVTTHPQAGSHKFAPPPPPTAAIRALMPKLADLPKEAEEEARTVEELRRENSKLKRELSAKVTDSKTNADMIEARQAGERSGYDRGFNDGANHAYKRGWDEHTDAVSIAIASIPKNPPVIGDARPENPERRVETHRPAEAYQERRTGTALAVPRARQIDGRASSRSNGTGEQLPKGEAATLAACIQFPAGLRREQLTVLTGYKRSSRDAYIQRLRERGYVDTSGDRVVATDDGFGAMPDAEPLPTGQALQDYWLARLPEGERKILGVLIERYPKAVPRADLDEETGYQRSSRDAYLQRLRAKQLVSEPSRGEVCASEDLFS